MGICPCIQKPHVNRPGPPVGASTRVWSWGHCPMVGFLIWPPSPTWGDPYHDRSVSSLPRRIWIFARYDVIVDKIQGEATFAAFTIAVIHLQFIHMQLLHLQLITFAVQFMCSSHKCYWPHLQLRYHICSSTLAVHTFAVCLICSSINAVNYICSWGAAFAVPHLQLRYHISSSTFAVQIPIF